VTISPSHIGTPAAAVVSAPFVLRGVIAQFLVFGVDRRYPRHLRLTDIAVIPGRIEGSCEAQQFLRRTQKR
jgi:hypothetical protein